MSKYTSLAIEVPNSYWADNHKQYSNLGENDPEITIRFVSYDPEHYMNIIIKEDGKTLTAASWTADNIKEISDWLNKVYRPEVVKDAKYIIVQDLSCNMPYRVFEKIEINKLIADFALHADALKFIAEKK
jgi:hypothetical protein